MDIIREKAATDCVMQSDFPRQVKVDLLLALTLLAQDIRACHTSDDGYADTDDPYAGRVLWELSDPEGR